MAAAGWRIAQATFDFRHYGGACDAGTSSNFIGVVFADDLPHLAWAASAVLTI